MYIVTNPVLGGRMWRCVGREDAYVEVVGRMWRCVEREDVEVCGEDVEVCGEGERMDEGRAS